MKQMQSDAEERGDGTDAPEDLGDSVQVKKRNARVAERNARIHAQYRKVMETRDGRELMHHLIYDKCGYDKKQFTGSSSTFANTGMLEVGQQIVRELKLLCFEQWAQMEREAMER
jgi:hypothetical protein